MRLWRIPGMPARCSAFFLAYLAGEIDAAFTAVPEPNGRCNVAPGNRVLLLSESNVQLKLAPVQWGNSPPGWHRSSLINTRAEAASEGHIFLARWRISSRLATNSGHGSMFSIASHGSPPTRPAPPVFADGRTGSARKGGLVADLRQVVFSQTGHFHDGIAVNAVLQHGAGNFEFAFIATFFNTALFT